jgi:two-component system, LuxR family, response regulator FixJ
MARVNTVFVVDDDPLLCKSLSLFLQAEGFSVEVYTSPRAYLDACQPDCYGCVILDIGLPDMDGLALQQALSERGIHLPIIFLTGQGNIPKVVQAVKGGAVDFLEKPASDSEILLRVRVAMAHEAKRRTEERRSLKLKKRFTSLTPSEHKVMSLLILDMRNKEIGKKLNISHRTVEVHRSRVMEKMKAESLLELMEMARAGGLIEMTRSSKRKCDI